MAKQYANIQPGFDTFAAWVTKTNNLLDDMTNIVVTVASNSAGAITTGNAHITGTLSGTTGTFNTLRGGNVSTNAALTIASNVAIANGYTLYFGNSSVNTTINATSFSGMANSANALTTSRNVALTTDATGNGNFDGTANLTIAVTLANSGVTANTYGNTTVYPVITVDAKGRVTAVTAQTVSVPAAGVTSFNTRTGAVTLTAADITGNSSVGLNYTPVSANTSGTIAGSLTLTSGDLTLRDVISSRDIRAGNSTVNAVVNAVSITVGNSTIYTTLTSTTVNTGTILLGNSTVNAVVNSTLFSIGNTTVNTVVNTTSVTIGNTTVNSVFSAANTVLYTPTIRGSRETVLANTTAAGAMTLDLSYGIHRWTVTGNITSLNYTNVPANNTVFTGTLYVMANSAGTNATNRTITFPSTANASTGKTLWSGGLAPPQTSSNSSVDIYSFFTIDGGNNYVWSLSVKDAK
jgi:hypothetical protein